MSVVELCLTIQVLSVGTVASSVVYESNGKMGKFDSEMVLFTISASDLGAV